MITSFDWQLDNWMRWCRRRDWLPLGHVSQLGFMIKQAKEKSESATDSAPPVYEIQALEFNRLIMRLPRHHMAIFLLQHLDKGISGYRIVYTNRASRKHQLAGVSSATFYRRVKEAEAMITRWMT